MKANVEMSTISRYNITDNIRLLAVASRVYSIDLISVSWLMIAWGRFSMKMWSYQHMNSHYKDITGLTVRSIYGKSIAGPWGKTWGAFCESKLQCCIDCYVILDRVIAAPDYNHIVHIKQHFSVVTDMRATASQFTGDSTALADTTQQTNYPINTQ